MRRSARSTKGQHSRFAAEEAEILEAAKKGAAPSATSQSQKKKKSFSKVINIDPHDSDIVRCICNKVYENDTQMMAQCEQCFTWQHVKCLYGKEDGKLLPEVYYCPICRPPTATPTKNSKVVKKEQMAVESKETKKRLQDNLSKPAVVSAIASAGPPAVKKRKSVSFKGIFLYKNLLTFS